MSRKAFFAAHCTHRFDQFHWGRLSEKSNIPQCESRIRFRPCIGVRSISVSRGLFGQSGGAGTSLEALQRDDSGQLHLSLWGRWNEPIGAAESERYSSMSERETPSEREALSERDAMSERDAPSERDADAADYESGHSDAEFNEAAYPLAAGLDADCSCLK